MMAEMWTPADLAEFLKVTTQELSEMRCNGTGPEFTKFRRNIRYNPRKVSEWLEANSRKSTKEESNA